MVLVVSVQCALRVSTVRLPLVMAALAQIVVPDILLRVVPLQELMHLLVLYVLQAMLDLLLMALAAVTLVVLARTPLTMKPPAHHVVPDTLLLVVALPARMHLLV